MPTPLSVSLCQNGPQWVGAATPKRSASHSAAACPSRAATMVWFSCTGIDQVLPREDGAMGKVHGSITPPVAAWIAEQHMFFVATAPLAGDGHVNLSPKGLDTLRLLDDRTV